MDNENKQSMLTSQVCSVCKSDNQSGKIHKVRLESGDKVSGWVCDTCIEYVCDFCGRYDKENGFARRLQDSHKDSYLGWLCFACDDRLNEYAMEVADEYAQESEDDYN